jgi:hypothetical protein
VSADQPQDTGGTLLARVLAAAEHQMTGPSGEPLEVDLEVDHRLGQATVTYRLGDTVLAVRRLRVDERSRVVALLDLELPRWWFDGTSVHEQLVANLDTDCLLTATLTGPQSWIWTPYFDWARGMANANAAALAAAVEAVTPPPDQPDPVWGGSDLSERVLLLAGADPRRDDGRGSWRHLVESTTPAGLVAALEDLHSGLAQVVFAHVPAWYGERSLP